MEALRPLAEILGSLPNGMVGTLSVVLLNPAADRRANLESVRLFGTEVAPALREIATQ